MPDREGKKAFANLVKIGAISPLVRRANCGSYF